MPVSLGLPGVFRARSFNYSAAADSRNTENVTFIDSPIVAGWFLTNWQARRDVSEAWQGDNPTRVRALGAKPREVGVGGRITPEALVLMQDEDANGDLAAAAVTE